MMEVDNLPDASTAATDRVDTERHRFEDRLDEAFAGLLDHQANATATAQTLTVAAEMIREADTNTHAQTEYMAEQAADHVAEMAYWFTHYAAALKRELQDW